MIRGPHETDGVGLTPTSSVAETSLPLRALMVRGTASLAISTLFYRGLGYIGILVAARVAGPESLGKYSAVIATVSFIAGLAGISLGVVASRFAGIYPIGAPGHSAFLKTFAICSLAAATVAGGICLVAGSFVSSNVMSQPELGTAVRWGALVAMGFIAWDAIYNLCVGLFKFRWTLALSCTTGALTFTGLVGGAYRGHIPMVTGLGIALVVPCVIVALLAFRHGDDDNSPGPGLRQLLAFGLVQNASGISIAAASWLVIATLARHDPSGRSVGLYTVGQQLNSLAAMAPGIALQLVVPLVGRLRGSARERAALIGSTTFISTVAALVVGGPLVILGPTIIDAYGNPFGAASKAAVLLIAGAILSTSVASPATALLATNVRTAAKINLIWALVLSAAALLLVPRWGPTGAGIAWLLCQAVSGIAVLRSTSRLGLLPARVASLWGVNSVLVTGMAILGYTRAEGWGLWPIGFQLLLLTLALVTTVRRGVSEGHLPRKSQLRALVVLLSPRRDA